MRRPRQLSRFSLGLATVLTAGTLGGCRAVTVVSFMPVDQTVDSVIVDTDQTKDPIQLAGLDETVGFYNLTGSKIHITTSACMGDTLVYSSVDDPELPADHIFITVKRATDGPTKCPKVDGKKVTYDHPDSGPTGLGGAAGSGEIGGASGSGGSTGTGGSTGQGGSDAGAGGAAGATGAGGCNDAGAGGNAGQGAVDAGLCDPPIGPAEPPPSGDPSSECVDYCNRIVGPRDGGGVLCPDSYTDVSECLSYCRLVNWIPGTSLDMKDSMGCRRYNLTIAESQPVVPALRCGNAGPSGNGGMDTMACGYASGGTCVTFCNAWGNICGEDTTSCLSACAGPSPPQTTCRFKWLRLAASSDRRYCQLVSLSSSCRLPDC